MDTELLIIVFNIAFLLFLSGLFSGAETAYTALSPAKVEAIKEDKKFGSQIIPKLYTKLDMVITLTLVLSNTVNIYLSAYITVLVTKAFGEGVGFSYAVFTGTILILILGEIIPKKLAILFPAELCRFTAHIIYALYYLLYPIVLPVNKFMLLMDKLGNGGNQTSEAEIKALLSIGEKDGALEAKEYQMMRKLLQLNDKEVKDIMTPRSDIIAVKSSAKLSEVVKIATKNRFSRIPIYNEDVSEIDSVVTMPEVTALMLNKDNWEKPISEFSSKKAFKVPESKIIDDLFFEFQKKRVHLAIVLDEYGETSGVVSLEDIVEEIFGEIEDETDIKEIKIRKIGKIEAHADGTTSLAEISETLKINFGDEYPENKSISWLVLEILHRFPNEGEKIGVPGTKLEVTILDMDEEYIDLVGLKIVPEVFEEKS